MTDQKEQAMAKFAPLLKAWLDEMQTPMYLDRMLAVAIDRHIKYQAHIRAGFSEPQAIDLCCK